MVWRIEQRSSELAVWRWVLLFIQECLAIFASDSKKGRFACVHIPCVVSDESIYRTCRCCRQRSRERSELLLSLLSGRRRRRRSGAVSSDQGQTVHFGRLRLVFVEFNISIGAERALADKLSLFPHDVFDRDACV